MSMGLSCNKLYLLVVFDFLCIVVCMYCIYGRRISCPKLSNSSIAMSSVASFKFSTCMSCTSCGFRFVSCLCVVFCGEPWYELL